MAGPTFKVGPAPSYLPPPPPRASLRFARRPPPPGGFLSARSWPLNYNKFRTLPAHQRASLANPPSRRPHFDPIVTKYSILNKVINH